MGDWLRVRGEDDDARLDVGDELTVGRGQAGLGALAADGELSRRHARFASTEAGGLTVEDLGSSNGTFVNGERIRRRADLEPGDVVLVGTTELEVIGDRPTRIRAGEDEPAAGATRPRATAPKSAPPPPPPPPRPAAPPPPPPPPRAATAPRASEPFPPAAAPPRSSDPRVPLLAVLLVLALAGLAVSLLLGGGEDSSDAAAAAGEPPYDGTAYVLSNRRQAGANSVVAMRYGREGFAPLRLREYPTGGRGARNIGPGSPVDGDGQIMVDRERRLLLAVNQGSDSIAVFRIADDGGLTAVKGSPFPSGGRAPIGIGLSESTAIVVNKGSDGLRKPPAPGSIVQFQLGDDGSLTPTGRPVPVPRGADPVQAQVIDRADLVVVPELVAGAYRTLRRGQSGDFTSGPTTPVTDPQRALGIPFRDALVAIAPPGTEIPRRLPPPPLGAQGLSVHPEQDVLYSELSPFSLLAVHTFDRAGNLTFVRGVRIQGGLLACWSRVSPDGRRLYVSNAATHTVAVFDLADPQNPKQIQLLNLPGGGGHTFNIEIDQTGKRLFVLDSFSPQLDRPGLGNQLHVLTIGEGGLLSAPRSGSPARLPVSFDTASYGLALMPREVPSEGEDS